MSIFIKNVECPLVNFPMQSFYHAWTLSIFHFHFRQTGTFIETLVLNKKRSQTIKKTAENIHMGLICAIRLRINYCSKALRLPSERRNVNWTVLSSCHYFINLKNIYYFPSCSGRTISLHHSFTPSLPVQLEIWEPGGRNFHIKREGMFVGKFEFNS